MADAAEYPMFAEEIELARRGFRQVAGVDEAGRGPLAGPVVAAAVILPPWSSRLAAALTGVDDSKRLTAARREELLPRIEENALAIGLCRVEPEEIERLNILQATMKAMAVALGRLAVPPQFVLVDGNHTPQEWPGPSRALVKGDSRSVSIAAASIVAKVSRDRIMEAYELQYPGYGFGSNKGYGSEAHLAALERFGLTDVHRAGFCRNALERRRQKSLFED
jgi:ribonuclease HII